MCITLECITEPSSNEILLMMPLCAVCSFWKQNKALFIVGLCMVTLMQILLALFMQIPSRQSKLRFSKIAKIL